MQFFNCIFFIKTTMEIRNNFLNFNKINTPSKQKTYNNGVLKADTFVKSSNTSFKGKADINTYLDKGYDNLNEREKEILRNELSSFDWEAVDDCLNTAKSLKHLYDEEYGEGNWEYVSIGRSCANIAKTLTKLGVKSYIIPISGLQGGINDGKELTRQKGFEKYKNFIYEQGLNPLEIENSGKTYIFQDYCDSGKSLRLFEQFIRSEQMGLDKENIVFKGINDSLFECIPKLREWGITAYNPILFLTQRLASQNTFMSMKHYTSCPKLYYRDLDDIEKIKDSPMQYHRLFDFGIEDRIKAAL